MKDEGYYAVRAVLIFLLECSSSTWFVDSPAFWPSATSRGRLLPKEKTLQRSPAPDLGCLTEAGGFGDGVLDFERQTVKYWLMAWNCGSAGRMEGTPGGVDDRLLSLDDVAAEAIESRALGSFPAPSEVPCGVNASRGDGDDPGELVLECAKNWLVALGLYYGVGLVRIST
jgi:hypothetical protein